MRRALTERFGAGCATVDFSESLACASAIAVASDFDPDARMAATARRPLSDSPSSRGSSDPTGPGFSLRVPPDDPAARASGARPTVTGAASRTPTDSFRIEAVSFVALSTTVSRKAPSLPLSRPKTPPARSLPMALASLDLPIVAAGRMSSAWIPDCSRLASSGMARDDRSDPS